MTNDNMETSGFDPMAWLTPSAKDTSGNVKTSCQPTQPTVCQPLSHAEELAKATATTHELIRLGANIADDYHDYVCLGFALANGLGSDGRNLYHLLCANSPKYRTSDCERKWQECLSKADGRTSIATFYHMARQAGVDINAIAKKYHNNQL